MVISHSFLSFVSGKPCVKPLACHLTEEAADRFGTMHCKAYRGLADRGGRVVDSEPCTVKLTGWGGGVRTC